MLDGPDPLGELFLLAEANLKSQALGHTPAAARPKTRNRVRAHVLFIPKHLLPDVRAFARTHGIPLLEGAYDSCSRRQTVYTNAANAARILAIFGHGRE